MFVMRRQSVVRFDLTGSMTKSCLLHMGRYHTRIPMVSQGRSEWEGLQMRTAP